MPASPERAPAPTPSLDVPWAMPWPEALERLAVDRQGGLSAAEAANRLARLGPNRLREPRRTSIWRVLANQLASIIVALLAAAAVVALAMGDGVEAAAIVAVIAINTLIGAVTEWQAIQSMDALRRLERVTARARRDGAVVALPAEQLVPGDLVLFEGGDVVTADLRLVEASKLQVDESMLTGESMPVGKRPEPLDMAAGVADRANMLFKGTLVTRGSGEGVVVATGMRTELGAIATLTEDATDVATPLEQRLEQLGRRLIWVTLVVALGVAVAGIMAQRPVGHMIEIAIALAVAAIPEGLPIVATLALARGMLRMARRKAIVQRLAAVETLGATSVICTDKTGTLTKNEMTVAQVQLADALVDVTSDAPPIADGRRAHLEAALTVGVLCNNATLDEHGASTGDPLEVALLRAGAALGLRRETLLETRAEQREDAFDATTKMMATVHAADGGRSYVAVKGAPESVLAAATSVATGEGDRALTDDVRAWWSARANELAARGVRLIALADRMVSDPAVRPYEALRLIGLVGLTDPPRPDAAAAIEACRRAGIHVVMVTGDQPLTARSIARAVGLVDSDDAPVLQGDAIAGLRAAPDGLMAPRIFARVTPKQKLDLIEAFQHRGQVVAMTGDGVNDAPALKKADIGVAMGLRGTQVAREAADMVLEDDAFATIVVAVRQGRIIFDNVRRFVLYLLSCNLSEVLLVGAASVTSAPLPILPLQILFLNLVTDIFPALALGLGEGSDEVMTRQPRPSTEPLLTRRHWMAMGAWAALISMAVLVAFWAALTRLDMSETEAVTVSFLTLAFAQLWHVFTMRSRASTLFANDIVRNPWVWRSLALCTGLLLAAVYLPPLARVLRVVPPGAAGWALVVSLSVAPAITGQLLGRLRDGPPRSRTAS